MTTSLRVPRVLAIDDETLWLDQLPEILHGLADVVGVANIDDAFTKLESECFDVVLLDLNFPVDVRTGVDVFKQIFALNRGIDVIVISGETDPRRIVEVCNAGVSRFIPKPANIEQVRRETKRVLESRLNRFHSIIHASTGSQRINPLIGRSSAIARLGNQVSELLRIGFSDLLIEGETGTGKEVMAKYLAAHLIPDGRLMPLHCGAISDGIAESELFGHVKGAFTGAEKDRLGVFEAASGGFVFLDEIGEMPLPQQAKLLRVLQERKVQRVGSYEERPVTFRAISATNVDLKKAVSERRFREDLYFRISKEVLSLPPLRDRIEDIPLLIDSMKVKNIHGEGVEFSNSAIDLLCEYHWPGNIRQFVSIVDGVSARTESRIIRDKDIVTVLPDLMKARGYGYSPGILSSYTKTIVAGERRKFEKALVAAKGNRIEAAQVLGLSRATYYRRAKALGLIGAKLPRF